MAFRRSARVGSWPVVVGVVLVAVAAWGFYAWRFGFAFGSRQSAEEVASVGDQESSLPDEEAPSQRKQQAERPVDSSAAVTVNSPGSFTEQAEMKLKEGVRPRGDEGAKDGVAARKAAAEPAAAEGARPRGATAEKGAPGGGTAGGKAASEGAGDLETGRAALGRGDLKAARAALSKALSSGLAGADEAFARGELERIADAMLFSRATNVDDPLVGIHVVAGGDSLNAIARQYKITEELLASINRISDPSQLPVGRRLKIIRGPFRAVIDKAAHRMDVYLGDVYVRGFKVGLGAKDGTPRGRWVVRNKLKNPEWVDPSTGHHYRADDSDNPIGERWIGLQCVEGECMGRSGFGLHGTIDVNSVGQSMSMGCIRLTPEGIAFVYDLLVDEYSQIVIK